jgi:hypothetical protein
MAVAKLVFEKNLANIPKPADMQALIKANMWEPIYPNFV